MNPVPRAAGTLAPVRAIASDPSLPRRRRALTGRGAHAWRWALFAVALLHLGGAHSQTADDVVVRTLAAVAYDDARSALLDAFVDEGLAPPSISAFGDMLARTAADLGHPARLYDRAEIFVFCSARIAALLAQETPHHIARCPLTLALYTVPNKPGETFLSYRSPPADSPASRLARELLVRVARRTAENAGLSP